MRLSLETIFIVQYHDLNFVFGNTLYFASKGSSEGHKTKRSYSLDNFIKRSPIFAAHLKVYARI
jgi:hypothetical protein